MVKDKHERVAYLDEGHPVKWLFFWGHTKPVDGSVTKTCLSQWYEAEFNVDGVRYPTAEHYMMAGKARLFNDGDAQKMILASKHPGEAKKIGRNVKEYDERIWREHRNEIVIQGNVAKFEQNEALKTFLLNTNDRILVEASPYDRIWGIGMAVTDDGIEKPQQWPGLNLLGFALMQVRERLRG